MTADLHFSINSVASPTGTKKCYCPGNPLPNIHGETSMNTSKSSGIGRAGKERHL